jgi:hypothetical protein
MPLQPIHLCQGETGTCEVRRTRANSGEWAQYYEAADRARAIVGDPFIRYIRRAAARERLLLIASGVAMAVMASASFVLVGS